MKLQLKAKLLSLVVVSLLAHSAVAEETQTASADLATREGLIVHVDGMVDFMRALDTNSDMAIRFMGQSSVNYFFTNRFGLATSVSFVNRAFKVGSASRSANFIDLMVGVVGRRIGDLFSESSIGFYEIGPFLSLPLGDFEGPLAMTFSSRSKLYYGLQFSGGTVYPITDSFAMGPAVTVKMAFADAVENASSNVWFWDVCFGLRATF